MVVGMSSSPLFKRTPLFLAISTLVSISSYSYALDEGSQQLPPSKSKQLRTAISVRKLKHTVLKIAQAQTN